MLPGHFPGNPIVPGAYLLAWAVQQADIWLTVQNDGRRVVSVARVKFLRPLRPGQTVRCAWHPGDTLRFSLTTDEATIATGALVLKAAE